MLMQFQSEKGMKGTIIFSFLVCSLIAITQASATELWQNNQHEIGSHGYLRTGLGSSDSQTPVCFKAPGAGSKYRLGNECENYGELSIYYRYRFGDGDHAPYVHYEYLKPFLGPYSKSIKLLPFDENYLEFGNIGGTPVSVTVGRHRFLRRDIHISDYFYMNRSGEGISIEGIPLGFAAFGYTYLRHKQVPAGMVVTNEVTQHNHDFSLYDVQVDPDASLALDFRLSRIAGKTFGPVTIHSVNGWAVSAEHKQKNILGGSNTFSIQYGRGAARSAWSTTSEGVDTLSQLVSAQAATDLEKAYTWRLVNHHLYEGNGWAMQSGVVWEDKHSVAFDGINQTWVSIGARPTYYIDEHWRLTGEAGLDYVKDKTAASDGSLVKMTIAMEWSAEKSYFSRPALRAYVSNAFWSNSFVGQVGVPVYADRNHGWNAGLQLETWW